MLYTPSSSTQTRMKSVDDAAHTDLLTLFNNVLQKIALEQEKQEAIRNLRKAHESIFFFDKNKRGSNVLNYESFLLCIILYSVPFERYNSHFLKK